MQDYFVPEVDRRLEAAGGEDVDAWLVREGWAMAYGRYSTAYVDQEATLHSARQVSTTNPIESEKFRILNKLNVVVSCVAPLFP